MLVIFKMTNLPKHSLPVRVAEDDKPDTTTFHLSEDGVSIINNILVNEEEGRNVATPNLAAGRNGGQEAGRNNADKTTTIKVTTVYFMDAMALPVNTSSEYRKMQVQL